MRRTALIIALIVALVPAAAGAKASYHGISMGNIVNDVGITADGGDYLAVGAGDRAFIFKTADVPVIKEPTENATPATTPTRAGGATAFLGLLAVAAAGLLLRR